MPEGGGRARVRMNGRERREQLVQVGRRLFAEKGLRRGLDRILSRDSAAGTSGGAFSSLLNDVANQVENVLVREFGQRGIATRHAEMYAQMLVGMVAVTGTWWLEERKPKREEVAAHIVNLGWNGLAHLETRPRAIAVPPRK